MHQRRADLLAGLLAPPLAELEVPYAAPGSRYQFLRQGYFCVDSVDSSPGALVFNRTVSLRDTWARMEKVRNPA